MISNGFEVCRQIPQAAVLVTNEVPGYEIEKPYVILGPIPEPISVITEVASYLNEASNLVVLPFLIVKDTAVIKYEVGGDSFSIRKNLNDESTVAVFKGRKKKFYPEGNREVVVARSETRIPVDPGQSPLTVAEQALQSRGFRGQLNQVDCFDRKKATAILLEPNHQRVYLLNVDSRDWVNGDQIGQVEVEYYGSLSPQPRIVTRPDESICRGVLMVSRLVATGFKVIETPIVAKNESKGLFQLFGNRG